MAVFGANQGETKAYPEQMEANPEEIESEAEHEKFPKEQAAMKPVGGLMKRHRGRNLVAERLQKPKEMTWGDCGSLKQLAAVGMRTTRRAEVAWRKGNVIRKNRTIDKVERGTLKGRTLGKRQRTRQEGNKGIKGLGGRQPLYLWKARTIVNGIRGWSSGQRSYLGSGGILKKTLYEISGSKIAKQMLETSIRMRKMRNWTLWRGWPPPEREIRNRTLWRGRIPPKRKNLLAALA
jgi:hypothetical protein